MSYTVLDHQDEDTSTWQIVDGRRPLYARAQRANYYTRTVTLESDLDWRHLRIVRFEEAPTEELDF